METKKFSEVWRTVKLVGWGDPMGWALLRKWFKDRYGI
jgi:hypothetical protein